MILIYDIDSAGGSWQNWHGRKEGGRRSFVQSEHDRCKHPVNPACNTGNHTNGQRMGKAARWGLEDHCTPPWGKCKDFLLLL